MEILISNKKPNVAQSNYSEIRIANSWLINYFGQVYNRNSVKVLLELSNIIVEVIFNKNLAIVQ